nr:MAG TPA: baseplate hub subunit and tail lysozyme [Caudoviricetes sp.]
MDINFNLIKDEILRRAKEARACAEQYARAYKAETMQDLCNVIKDNFDWAYRNMVIDTALLMLYRDDFAKNGIFVNTSVSKGYLLCDNATVRAYGNATVRAYGNATVEALGNATVRACDNATVEAWGNATVEAWGNATVEACDNATVEALGNATVEACDNATVEACDNATVEACDNATVEALGNAYVSSYAIVECKLSENAIYRVRSTQTVFYASDNITFKKH